MKKIVALFLSLLAAAGLTACNSTAQLPGSGTSGTAAVGQADQTPQTTGNVLRALKAGTDSGRYGTSYQIDHTILCYIDYASASDTALCAQPSCNHDSESCTAYIPKGQILSSLYAVDNQFAAFVVSPNSPDEGGPVLYLADKGGGNRRTLFQASSGQDFWELICVDDQYLYFSLSTTQEEGQTIDLYRVPLAGGEAEAVFPLSDSQILGLSGRNLVCYSYQYEEPENRQEPQIPEGAAQEEIDQMMIEYQEAFVGTHRVFLHSIDDGTEQELESWTSTMGNEGRVQYWQDDRLYWLDCNWNKLPQVIHWTDENRQTGEVALTWPDQALQDIQNNKEGDFRVERLELVLENRAMLTVRGPETRRYAVDLETGSVTEIPLRYQSNGKEIPVAILGQSSDSLLVEIEVQMKDVTYIQDDGTPTMNGAAIGRYALIPFADFFAGKPNYREVTTQYIQTIW